MAGPTPAAWDALRAAVSARDLVDVDCGGLTFCHCSGLTALLAAARAAEAGGSALRLRAVR
ncbi:STAS domain-containing protein [Streptomyces sp. NL15-2K]|uniref:STAS domain-containing protein n=1 Tax=Streptomyces sp. NL15-2K TaxID=376149 RepID=UPI000FFAB1CA|nr:MULTISPECIES: STAS domain-containing protein [Actinomycetes]WKX13776.1 STAS domain-containing protein [Kutzneria buriramensis]GCB44817.1 hypothetical protein SNL152K_2107 [Streptomyces sp. NL15-2K]